MMGSAKPPRKNRKLQPWTLAKDNRVYSRNEVLRIYGISDNTISNWIQAGLVVAYDGNKQVFRGRELNSFHLNRALARKHPCDGAYLYCVRCKGPHLPVNMVCDVLDEEGVPYTALSWTCSGCGQPANCLGYSRVLTRLSRAGVTLNPSNKNGDS